MAAPGQLPKAMCHTPSSRCVELVEHFELLPNPVMDEAEVVTDPVSDLSMDFSSTSETPNKNALKKELKKTQKEEEKKR